MSTLDPPDDENPKVDHAIRLQQLRDLFFGYSEQKWSVRELATRYHVSDDTIRRDLQKLSTEGGVPLVSEGFTNQAVWYVPSDMKPTMPPLQLTYEQGTAIYIATRLLSQQHDESINGVQTAIDAVVRIMPKPLQSHLKALTHDMQQRASGRANQTAIFAALSQGWLKQRRVTILYDAPGKRSLTGTFAPYLAEPSGVGYTVYFMGHCDPIDRIITLKLERIRHATLTDIPFTIPSDFDGPARLRSAWRVMYGEEGTSVHIMLKFSHAVSARVRETRWHVSESLTDAADGLIWEADIGDVTEIRPWIRGWGADCEVLEPATLRQDMTTEVQRMMRVYGIAANNRSRDEPDDDLFTDLFR